MQFLNNIDTPCYLLLFLSTFLCKTARYLIIAFQSILLTVNLFAQSSVDTNKVNQKLLGSIIAVESISTVTSLAGLSVLWYADYPKSSFHLFNDNKEWLQMDKVSHAAVSYSIGKAGFDLLRWPGVKKKKAVWYGGTAGFFYLAAIELMDGFSAEWGASLGDLTANAIGSAGFISQQLVWDEQRILLKWSYSNSKYSQYRPNTLGRNLPERMLKDYNGQTGWLSVNIRSFLQNDSRFPEWLNVALGYSADGMLGGDFNPVEENGKVLPSFERTRQYFLSLDLDLSRIKTRSKALKLIFNTFGFIKIPFPAVEYNSGRQWILHGIYF